MKRTPEEDLQVFLEDIRVDANDCYLWVGCVSPNGYGVVQYDGRAVSTHRLAYQMEYGEIPDFMCVLHRCDVRRCVNPEHLFLGTKKENSQDMISKGRANRLPRKQVKVTSAELADMVRRHDSGQSWYRIGLDLNRSQQHVKSVVEKHRGVQAVAA